MKYINDSFYFVPRFTGIGLTPLTVDNIEISVDSNFISADQIIYSQGGDFILELTNEFTKEVTFPAFEWEDYGNFMKITFDETYNGFFSVHLYSCVGTLYKGRFASNCLNTKIINNKMYL